MSLMVPLLKEFVFTDRWGLIIVSIQDLHTIMRAVTVYHFYLKVSEGQSHVVDWKKYRMVEIRESALMHDLH